MEKPWLGKALSERAKLYRKPRARPNFLVQLIDSDCEFTIDSGYPPGRPSEEMLEQPFAAARRRARRFCAIIAGTRGVRVAPRIPRGRTAADKHPRSPPKLRPLNPCAISGSSLPKRPPLR